MLLLVKVTFFELVTVLLPPNTTNCLGTLLPYVNCVAEPQPPGSAPVNVLPEKVFWLMIMLSIAVVKLAPIPCSPLATISLPSMRIFV